MKSTLRKRGSTRRSHQNGGIPLALAKTAVTGFAKKAATGVASKTKKVATGFAKTAKNAATKFTEAAKRTMRSNATGISPENTGTSSENNSGSSSGNNGGDNVQNFEQSTANIRADTTSRQNYRERVKEKIVEILKFLWEPIKGFFSNIFKHLSKWIAFFLVIVFVYWLLFGKSSSNERRQPAYENKQDTTFIEKVKATLNSVSKSARSIRAPLGKNATNGMPRDSESNGRCNDVEWVSMEGTLDKKNVGLCFQSSIEKPTSIRWIIDPTNLYEYDTLPSVLKEKLQSEPEKLVVTIPYINKGSSFVLSCKDAVYGDGSSAKDLFSEETDKYCKLKTKTLENSYKYTEKKRALRSSPDYKGLDVYEMA